MFRGFDGGNGGVSQGDVVWRGRRKENRPVVEGKRASRQLSNVK